MPAQEYLRRILTARVYDVAIESPLEDAPRLSARIGHRVLLKREDLQPVKSFKLRGAYNRMARLPAGELKRGVIAASAGNHAQGVALAAQQLGCRAVIVMPVTTPQVKVEAVLARDAEVELHGDSYSDAYAHARVLQAKRRLTFVHPFDDPDVIAGQGTIAMEILRQHHPSDHGPLHAVFVPIGGGGLAAGIAAYVKAIAPEVQVIGVQTQDSDAMARSVAAKRRIQLADVGLFSDGTAVRQVGEETFRLCRKYVDAIVSVDTDAICAAIKDVFADTRSILEPAGALSVAGLKAWVARHAPDAKSKGLTLVAVASGANMNFDRLRFVAERTEVGEAREALFAVTIPEERGSFRRFCELVGNRNVTEFNYRISDARQAQVFVGIATSNAGDNEKLARSFNRHGYATVDLTHDELAAEHVRYMVGGKSALAVGERVLRFEFPERPGALMRFLTSMRPGWNISMFHYRNQGADYSRVLVGLQVPDGELAAFRKFLQELGYRHWDETANPSYRLFLA